ncbi:hypothetical protein [Nocardioides sp.]|uniref:hypothetical protein n=1 Tax=Nocardioides sp. TaxID=35761 RepID=UPI003528C18B
MSTPAGWFPEPTPGGDSLAEDGHEIQPLALVLALVPLLGIVLGAVAMARGRQLTGFLMIAVSIASSIIVQTYHLALT